MELDPADVQEARRSEIGYIRKLRVYEEATKEEMQADGCKPIPVRWIDVNKGDVENMLVRSRLVAQETRRRSDMGNGVESMAATFAATPPLEALRLLISLMMCGEKQLHSQNMRVLGFYDISRAHFHAPARRKVYIIPPKEDTEIKTGIARLLQSMYGTRDAAQCFDAFSEETMAKLGFQAGTFNPCIYFNAERSAICLRHGDDFILLADRSTQRWFYKSLGEHMLTKHLGNLGPRKDLGDIHEVRCLNRLMRWVQPAFKAHREAYIEWEPDPRHVEISAAALGLQLTSKSLSTPGIKQPKSADTTVLDDKDREVYRSNVMRLAYLAQDRIELPFSSKELARNMQAPTQFDMEQLKRAVRFLIGTPR